MSKLLKTAAFALVFCVISSSLTAQLSLSGQLNTPNDPGQQIPPTTVNVYFPYAGDEPLTLTALTSGPNNAYQRQFGSEHQFFPVRAFVDINSSPSNFVNLRCVTTFDVSRIVAHVQNNAPLTSAQRIAADVNLDGFVSPADFNMTRLVVLGRIVDFDNVHTVNGTTYQDVAVVYPTESEVLNQGSPISYTSVYNNPFPPSNLSNIDFAAINLGDLIGNCSTFFSPDEEVISKVKQGSASSNTHEIIIKAKHLADNTYEISLLTQKLHTASVFSFELLFSDKIKISSVKSKRGVLNYDTYAFSEDRKSLKIMAAEGFDYSRNMIAQTSSKLNTLLTFEVQGPVNGSNTVEHITLGDGVFENVVYARTDDIGETLQKEIRLAQDDFSSERTIEYGPNPFSNNMFLRTTSETETIRKITGYNSVGQVVFYRDNILQSEYQLQSQDIEHLPTSIYILEVELSNSSVERIQVQKYID